MPTGWTTSLLVGLGGFTGSIARYGLSAVLQRLALSWPVGTLSVNVLGCLIVGFLSELAARGAMLSLEVRLALVTGFCGGFTTMSAMISETAAILRACAYFSAILYVLGSIFLSMLAFMLGLGLARALIKWVLVS